MCMWRPIQSQMAFVNSPYLRFRVRRLGLFDRLALFVRRGFLFVFDFGFPFALFVVPVFFTLLFVMRFL